jgi:hypothetical protein
VLHFGPAVDTVMAAQRRGCSFQDREWDSNPQFANMSRSQVIAAIENTTEMGPLENIMKNPDIRTNFASIYPSRPSVVWCNFPAITSGEDFIRGVEFAKTFTKAAFSCRTLAQLLVFPPTTDGYNRFIAQGRWVPGSSEDPRIPHSPRSS